MKYFVGFSKQNCYMITNFQHETKDYFKIIFEKHELGMFLSTENNKERECYIDMTASLKNSKFSSFEIKYPSKHLRKLILEEKLKNLSD